MENRRNSTNIFIINIATRTQQQHNNTTTQQEHNNNTTTTQQQPSGSSDYATDGGQPETDMGYEQGN